MNFIKILTVGTAGKSRGGTQQNVYTGRLRPEVQPLTLYIPFFTKKVILLYTFY